MQKRRFPVCALSLHCTPRSKTLEMLEFWIFLQCLFICVLETVQDQDDKKMRWRVKRLAIGQFRAVAAMFSEEFRGNVGFIPPVPLDHFRIRGEMVARKAGGRSASCLIRPVAPSSESGYAAPADTLLVFSVSFVGQPAMRTPVVAHDDSYPRLAHVVHTRGTYLAIQGFTRQKGEFETQKNQTEAVRLGNCLVSSFSSPLSRALNTGLTWQCSERE